MKMGEKGISTALIVAIVVTVVVVAVAVPAVILLKPGEPAPGEGIAGATSLAFKSDYLSGEYSGTMSTLKLKNLGLDSMKIRVEGTFQGQELTTVIVNGELQKAWLYSSGQWMDWPFSGTVSPPFEHSGWDWMTESLEAVEDTFSGWTSGEFTTTDPITGVTIRVYDIEVNPLLEDSLFVHSG